jgi:hypothetical protein
MSESFREEDPLGGCKGLMVALAITAAVVILIIILRYWRLIL